MSPSSATRRARLEIALSLCDARGSARLTPEVIARALAALGDARAGDLVLMEGTAEAFCTGMDLSLLDETPPDRLAALPERYGALLAAIASVPCPVIAVVAGEARGGGVGIAAAADLVIASPGATFSLPEVLLGLVPAMVFPPLARRVGVVRARLLAMGGTALDGPAALRAGLVDELAPDPRKAAERHAMRFARMDARAVAEVKRLVQAHYGAAPADWATDSVGRFAALAGSDETRARLARFAAGEAPWDDGGTAS